MLFTTIFHIASSAMVANSQRLSVSASNLANADSVAGPDGQPYVAKQVVFQVDNTLGPAIGGVKVAEVINDPTPPKLVYDPGHPLADTKGYVNMPNVNMFAENVNIMGAYTSYESNAFVINTTKAIIAQILKMGQ